MIALGIVLTLSAGSSTILGAHEDMTPIVIAREAEAVTRAVRLWIKRPVAGVQPAVAPASHSVGCGVQVSDAI
jgi:hypothetical protein